VERKSYSLSKSIDFNFEILETLSFQVMAMPRLEEFYAFMGRKGPNERELMCELVSSPNFKLSSDSRQPTVRIRNYFVVNQYGDLASFEELTGGKVFLQGTLVSNDGMGAGFLVGHIPVRKWYVFSPVVYISLILVELFL